MGARNRLGLWTGLVWAFASIAFAEPSAAPAGEKQKQQQKPHELKAVKKAAPLAKAKAFVAAHKQKKEEAAKSGQTPANAEAPAANEQGATPSPADPAAAHVESGPGSKSTVKHGRFSTNIQEMRTRARTRVTMMREGRLDELKKQREDRKEEMQVRRKERWKALQVAFKDKKADMPAVQLELRHHARRIAQLSRIAALADADKKPKLVTRVEKLVELENAHHEKRMAALHVGEEAPAGEANAEPTATPEGAPATATTPTETN